MENPANPRAALLGRPLSLADQIARTLRLAGPVMAARAGMIIMISVDTAMCGHAGASDLAYYGIALAPIVFVMVLGIGCLTGTVVLTAQADGAGRPQDCGKIWRSALFLGALVGSLAAIAALSGEGLLRLLGQSADVAAGGGEALIMAGLGMPGLMLYIASGFFLEGLGRPTPGMIIALCANILNAGLNWLVIEGNLGAPAMGAAGAMLATSATRWIMFLVIAFYILRMDREGRLGIIGGASGLGPSIVKLLRLGLPLSLAISFESSAFTTVTLFAGRLGETSLAAYQAAHNVTTLVFMLALGLGTAAAVRVANAIGRLDRRGVAAAGWVAFGLVILLMIGVGLLVGLFKAPLARIYSDDAAVLGIMVAGLSVIAFLVVLDGAQAVLVSALRGAGDVLVPSAIYALSFPLVAIPAAYHLGIGLESGVPGLLWGLCLGLLCASLLLGWRFSVVSRRPIRPL